MATGGREIVIAFSAAIAAAWLVSIAASLFSGVDIKGFAGDSYVSLQDFLESFRPLHQL